MFFQVTLLNVLRSWVCQSLKFTRSNRRRAAVHPSEWFPHPFSQCAPNKRPSSSSLCTAGSPCMLVERCSPVLEIHVPTCVVGPWLDREFDFQLQIISSFFTFDIKTSTLSVKRCGGNTGHLICQKSVQIKMCKKYPGLTHNVKTKYALMVLLKDTVHNFL